MYGVMVLIYMHRRRSRYPALYPDYVHSVHTTKNNCNVQLDGYMYRITCPLWDEDPCQSFKLTQPGAYPRNGALTLSACCIYNLGSHSLIPALLTQARAMESDKMMERYYVYHRKNGGKKGTGLEAT